MNLKYFITIFISLILSCAAAQTSDDQIYIDANGIMHWSKDKSEVYGFGVNYTLPFAHTYRMAKHNGVSIKDAFRDDVYHMSRLDLDLYRVHVWDTEISDTLGNLINNDHLQLFDYLINEMKQRGMHFIITPIAYWGNGWPEPDQNTPGFSHKYGKDNCLTNSDAIKAQVNYLNQFLNHVNSYTGVAYKDEPGIIAFEICNEPQHNQTAEKVTEFINTMVASMRSTGCTKPIFYNVSQKYKLDDAYLSANIQGTTFQWYPTNLVANHEINGNFLPQVSEYRIPFANNPKFKKKAKIVYEFDPADVGGNIMYTAMARTFRENGMQLATQFAYDALCWAPYNTNYGTHFMNMAYAPQKAMSLKIASAIFHNIPLYEQHENKNQFEGFHIDYENDLVEWVTNSKFFYSNNTLSKPETPAKLNEIAGVGSSPLVNYSGTGIYFMDKLVKGVWRLEVMPDAYWINDPYSPVNPEIQKSAVLHTQQTMQISLADLGEDFSIEAINKGNKYKTEAVNGEFEITPGTYIVKRKNVKINFTKYLTYKNINIDEFVAPASNLSQTVLWNNSPEQIIEDTPTSLKFKVVSPKTIQNIILILSNNNNWKTINISPEKSNLYEVTVPENLLQQGFLNYQMVIMTDVDTTTFPSKRIGNPWDWYNKDNKTFTLSILPENNNLEIWNAKTDWEFCYKNWDRNVNLKPNENGVPVISIDFDTLPTPDPNDDNYNSYAFKFYFLDKIKGRENELQNKKTVVININNKTTHNQATEVGFTDREGNVKVAQRIVKPGNAQIEIPLNEFIDAPFLVLPRPFPEFLPYKIDNMSSEFNWKTIEVVQFEVKSDDNKKANLEIEKIIIN